MSNSKTNGEIMKPEQIELVSADVLTITWNDGHKSLYFIKNLRDNCPCATCNDRRNDTSSLKIIDLQQQKSTITGWEIVGRYAVKFNWSDNHDTGIYTYEFLRKLCQCDECAKEK